MQNYTNGNTLGTSDGPQANSLQDIKLTQLFNKAGCILLSVRESINKLNKKSQQISHLLTKQDLDEQIYKNLQEIHEQIDLLKVTLMDISDSPTTEPKWKQMKKSKILNFNMQEMERLKTIVKTIYEQNTEFEFNNFKVTLSNQPLSPNQQQKTLIKQQVGNNSQAISLKNNQPNSFQQTAQQQVQKLAKPTQNNFSQESMFSGTGITQYSAMSSNNPNDTQLNSLRMKNLLKENSYHDELLQERIKDIAKVTKKIDYLKNLIMLSAQEIDGQGNKIDLLMEDVQYQNKGNLLETKSILINDQSSLSRSFRSQSGKVEKRQSAKASQNSNMKKKNGSFFFNLCGCNNNESY